MLGSAFGRSGFGRGFDPVLAPTLCLVEGLVGRPNELGRVDSSDEAGDAEARCHLHGRAPALELERGERRPDPLGCLDRSREGCSR